MTNNFTEIELTNAEAGIQNDYDSAVEHFRASDLVRPTPQVLQRAQYNREQNHLIARMLELATLKELGRKMRAAQKALEIPEYHDTQETDACYELEERFDNAIKDDNYK